MGRREQALVDLGVGETRAEQPDRSEDMASRFEG
jgi:hypothetical protein